MAINTTVENINNQPTIQPQTVTGIFTKYIAKTLPLAFDESMSYYECICALLEYLNDTIVPDINNTNAGLAELQTFYDDLQNYVNDYFDNLDVQEEINNKLDAMTLDGSLEALIGAYIQPRFEAQNARIDGLESEISSIASGSPKGVYATVSALETADPNHSYVYLVTADGKWYYYNTGNSTWTAGGVYQTSESTSDVAGLTALMQTKNLYDEDTFTYGYISQTGTIVGQTANVWEITSDYILAPANSKITTISIFPENFDTTTYTPWHCLASYDTEKTFISRQTDSITIKTLSNGQKYCIVTYTTPANTVYIRSSFRSYLVGKYLILYGDTNNIYKPYTLSYNDEKKADEILNRNDFNAELERGFIHAGTGENDNQEANLLKRARTKNYLKCEAGSYIYFKFPYNRNLFRFAVRYYDENFNYIAYIDNWNLTTVKTLYSGYIRLIFKHAADSHELTDEEITNLQNNIIIKKVDATTTKPISDFNLLKWTNSSVKTINHRGYNTIAPENTLPAFKLSKQNGFDYIECDVQFTSDHIPVIIHDDTINRTGRNADGTSIEETIYVADCTYEDLLDYDFGVYKGSEWAGTKIPTLAETLTLCRNIGLKVYVELKENPDSTNLSSLINVINNYGIINDITFISFSYNALMSMKTNYPKNRLGVLAGLPNSEHLAYIQNLQNEYNEVFCDISTLPDGDVKNSLLSNHIPIEMWTIDSTATLSALPSYVSGITTNSLLANKYLYDENIDLD